jgi:hypothetical protein
MPTLLARGDEFSMNSCCNFVELRACELPRTPYM